jgi:hypothetical protein
MNAALMLDLDDALDFPGNTAQALGRPLAAYPLIAARATAAFPRLYFVTASPALKTVALQNSAVILDPVEGGDAEIQLRLGYQSILEDLKQDGQSLDLLAVFFSNAPALTGDLLQQGLDALHRDPALDSAVTVSPYNRWNPFFARKEGTDGLLEPFMKAGPDPRGDVWYPDWGAQILRARCLEGKAAGQPPFPWLGKKIFPMKQWGGGPIDYKWQIPSLEYWLQKHGFSDLNAHMEPQPKLQPAPKPKGR